MVAFSGVPRAAGAGGAAGALREEVLRPGQPVRAQRGHAAARVPVRGGLQGRLHARLWIGRQVLRKPLPAASSLVPAEEENLHYPQQGLFLQR